MNIKIPDYLFPLAIAILMAVLLKPMVLDGLSPQGVDVIGSKGQTHQLKEYQNQTGETALYNPYLFGGMPIYFRIPPKAVSIDTLFRFFGKLLSDTYLWYIFGGTGMFLLLRFLGLSQLPSFFGALGFVLYPHYQALWAEGHFMKFRAVMIIPWVTLSSTYFFRTPNLFSMGLFALAWGNQIRTQHYQIVFYTALLIFVIGIIPLIQMLRNKEWKTVLIIKLLTLSGILIALMIASQPLFLAGEYLPYSARGAHTVNLKSPVTDKKENAGVDIKYATNWSTHPTELATWIFPHFYGGMSGLKYDGDSYPALKGKTIPGYWGYMPFTQSYEYMGPLILLLLVLGIIHQRKNKYILGMVGLGIFFVFLSFGRHFESFYSLFFDYLPYFNKFRAPMMSVTMTYFIIILIASFGLEFLINFVKKKDFRRLMWIISCFFGFGVLCWFLSSGFSFTHGNDSYGAETIRIIKGIRIELFQNDLIRYLLILGAVSGLVSASLMGKINRYILGLLLIGVMAFDLINIQLKRPIQYSDVKKQERKYFKQTQLDKFLQKDKDLFRIFPVGKLFGSNQWSYYHQSIGGYSAVKMNGIEELITNNLYHSVSNNFPLNLNVVAMMNVKYLISSSRLSNPSLSLVSEISGQSIYIYSLNDFLPRGFFVSQAKVIPNSRERLNYLNSADFPPRSEVIVEEALDFNFTSNDLNSAQLQKFEPGHLIWNLHVESNALFIMSESYYKPGWKATLNDSLIPIYKANHIYMAVMIPVGDHQLKLVFEPESFYQFATIEKMILYLLYIFILSHFAYKNRSKIPFIKSIK